MNGAAKPVRAARVCAPCFAARAAAAAGVGIAAGFALRYLAVEPEALARACEGASMPRWCLLRQGLVLAMQYHLVGLAGVLFGFFSLTGRSGGRRAATAALAIGGLGLALQNPLTGAAAVLIGMLALVRAWRLGG